MAAPRDGKQRKEARQVYVPPHRRKQSTAPSSPAQPTVTSSPTESKSERLPPASASPGGLLARRFITAALSGNRRMDRKREEERALGAAMAAELEQRASARTSSKRVDTDSTSASSEKTSGTAPSAASAQGRRQRTRETTTSSTPASENRTGRDSDARQVSSKDDAGNGCGRSGKAPSDKVTTARCHPSPSTAPSSQDAPVPQKPSEEKQKDDSSPPPDHRTGADAESPAD